MTAQFVGGAKLFQTVTGYSYEFGLILFGLVVVVYTTIGGFRAVALTDTCCAIMVDEKTSQNEIIIVPGACSTITPAEVEALRPLLSQCAYVLLQLEVNQDANEAVVKLAGECGCRVILNTAPYQPVSDEFLSQVYMVTPNEVEAEMMTGVKVDSLEAAKKAAAVFYEKGVKVVLITLGDRGVFLSENGREEILPAFKVKAVDTTGAGDAFNGGLLTALSEGRDLWEASRFASALAALSVQKIGTTPSM